MKSGSCISVLDPYAWLPGYGETRVNMRMNDQTLYVEIEYDGKDDALEQKNLIFSNAVDFRMASFPGVNLINIDYNGVGDPRISELVEFPESEAALQWTKYFSHRRRIRHFRIMFLSANVKLEIFASEVTLEDARPSI